MHRCSKHIANGLSANLSGVVMDFSCEQAADPKEPIETDIKGILSDSNNMF